MQDHITMELPWRRSDSLACRADARYHRRLMKFLVTGSSGHLGEALVRTLQSGPHEVVGLDLRDSQFTTHVGSVADSDFVRRSMRGVDVVVHTATLHKPHLATHSKRAFVDTNVTGTLSVLEAAIATGASGVVFTSTTSVFGAALIPADGEPAVWVTEDLRPVPKNIYGVTKTAAEELCELFYRSKALPSIVLRTSRFFTEPDDDGRLRQHHTDVNVKVNEYLNRRVDLADVVAAHLLAAEKMTDIGFGRFIVSATTPFTPEHLLRLRSDAPEVVRSRFPNYEAEYGRRGWTMPQGIDRVYVNTRAREQLGWQPRYDFRSVLDSLERGEEVFSPIALAVGAKGYQSGSRYDGAHPVERG